MEHYWNGTTRRCERCGISHGQGGTFDVCHGKPEAEKYIGFTENEVAEINGLIERITRQHRCDVDELTKRVDGLLESAASERSILVKALKRSLSDYQKLRAEFCRLSDRSPVVFERDLVTYRCNEDETAMERALKRVGADLDS